MNGTLDRIRSNALRRNVHLWRFGHYGMPLLVFPSAAGIAHEWLHNGIIDTLGDLIREGKLKIYCTETNVSESWTCERRSLEERVRNHLAFERYVRDELLPYVRRDCRSDDLPVAVAGASMGAYYAANFALKFPETFRYALCLSGRYDITWLTDGFNNDDVYYNNPVAYVPNMSGELLDRVREKTHLVLVCGRGMYEGRNIKGTLKFSEILDGKGISHQCEMWGEDVTHEPVWWRRQAQHYLGSLVG